MIPTLPPLCFQVTKNHYLKAFSSVRSVSTTISVCEGIFSGTKGQMYRSVQRNTCKWCNNLWILYPKLCKKQKPGSLGTGVAGALQEWRCTLLSWFLSLSQSCLHLVWLMLPCSIWNPQHWQCHTTSWCQRCPEVLEGRRTQIWSPGYYVKADNAMA